MARIYDIMMNVLDQYAHHYETRSLVSIHKNIHRFFANVSTSYRVDRGAVIIFTCSRFRRSKSGFK